ncbi:MAG: TlpA disulfide reductase family protein [Bacteroidota bacterium]
MATGVKAQDNNTQIAQQNTHQIAMKPATDLSGQAMLQDIFLGFDFQPQSAFSEAPSVSNVALMYSKVRMTAATTGHFWSARGKTAGGQLFYLFDRNDNGELRDEDPVLLPDSGMVYVEWPMRRIESDASPAKIATLDIRVRIHANANAEWQINTLWEATLHAKEEDLQVGIVRLTDNQFLAFADVDGDGVYEKYLDPAQPFGLGGPFWTYNVNFEAQVVVLSPTDKHPVAPGWKAPPLEGITWPDSKSVVLPQNTGKVTMLVFCLQTCSGCRDLAPYLREFAAAYGDTSEFRMWSVVPSAEEAAGNARDVSPDLLQVISPAAWKDYGVAPTPTVFVMNNTGEIVHRSIGTSKAIVEEIKATLLRHLNR